MHVPLLRDGQTCVKRDTEQVFEISHRCDGLLSRAASPRLIGPSVTYNCFSAATMEILARFRECFKGIEGV